MSGFHAPLPRRRGRGVCPITGKLRYGDKLTAERVLAAAIVSGNIYRREVRAYLCECGCWHLTSQPKETRDGEMD